MSHRIPALEGRKVRCIIAGGRDYTFTLHDLRLLDRFAPYISEVVSGCARGADRCGEMWAQSWGIPIKEFRADWERHGKAAGPIRNQEMAHYADAVILFPGGRGTESMREIAHEVGLLVFNLSK